ncbi:[protein-PII] uridylyltransferase [Ponticoccus sp. SC2-23]|uniref:[protein-PII] uridylyltransferase n=1 Tax=Alexandriicola marinus TaxID=2081710 RepID=UPI000FDA8888|nr:[protein-PII] uridylyltransferase [Alexandriicola marinus]MBM1220141.1 [protein-PII] uridylyltransferase [Ponticoccus sp. SC6-9]MBM1224827.1 [protein-PII] uridylyltransferase [Ponticoccus sp. SC6-15]MBM1228341.1 [protein-PII] uridylyltransferase [Ponticoccus sp. SC6-38]MBM1234022.1 [protein-PII] uridylyltransferase [Ponticoccus sp. SC6-45]MBM1238842.1 [protein-PII] uridylyltransferase [Ponticoccus sp. SC6-49]MBM1242624.1 [protein-PII] uridylyltransferase [Ponticoccus sp. SC2-64]MBM1247546
MQPLEASAAPVSETGPSGNPQDLFAPDSLICPAQDIFDTVATAAEIEAALADTSDPAEIRRAVVSIISRARKSGMAAIAEAFSADPTTSRRATSSYCWLTDRIVETVFNCATTRLHPIHNPTQGERLALVAVGGYGRGEMAPSSDVDLLFLTPYKVTPWAESVVESMLYMLWDLRLKVGHATRTVKDCLRLAGEDYTIRTSLVEYRYLLGDRALATELKDRLRKDLFAASAGDFIEAKLAERAERHRKQGGQRYVVEPNVKEGKGGLRDLQSLYWIAKYIYGVESAAELVGQGVFRPDEYDTFREAEDFLWAVRCHLHLITGRATDQLTFDMQVEVAGRMGYADSGGRRAVEHFMQDYFRHATRVGELTRIFLTALEANHTKSEPMLTRLFTRRKKAKPPYAIKQNRITVEDEKEFLSDPLNLLRLFEEALRTGTLIHPDAMRLLSANLDLITPEVQNDPEANKIFIGLLLKHGNPERALRRMNELGILPAFIPDFAPIVAMVQYNMYHSYTVDEHTIQCISNLSQIEREELVEELPIASGILRAGINRRVLYVALLLHDIGKGRPEDHSIVGARIARRLGPRLGLNKKECETVEWLIRYHLLMSDMAQKRDIAEPRTVRDFAKAVKTRERLDLLTVLTVCDIRGVGPNVWNNWKAALLRALHRATVHALENGLEDINREAREVEAKKALRDRLEDWDPKDLRQETSRHYGPYWQGLPLEAHVIFAGLLNGISDTEVRIDLKLDPDRDATRACFAMADHPGLFSRLTGALALVGANIVDARTYTSKDGFATAIFWIQDADGAPFEESRLPRLRKMIQRILAGEVIAKEALKDRDKIKKRERAFQVPTSITFDNDGSEIYTIIEVDTRDRPGLLYDLTRTLADAHVNIASAVIATYGEQVVDTFYVKDMFGLKYHAESKQKSLERKLRDAISRGSERAQE